MAEAMQQLLELSHRMGRRGDLAILGEGNTSFKTGADTFLVKASGSSLETLSAEQVTECRISSLLAVLDGADLTDKQIDEKLMESRVSPAGRKPSVEAYFHAYLLTLPGVNVVGHCHPEAVNGILAAGEAMGRKFATQRQCPDEIVCCGAESLYLPYIDPGLRLSREIRAGVKAFVGRTGRLPKVILLGNHGVICPAGSVAGVWSALAMVVKAARIFTAAEALGGARAIPAEDCARLDGRPDEEYRRAVLGI